MRFNESDHDHCVGVREILREKQHHIVDEGIQKGQQKLCVCVFRGGCVCVFDEGKRTGQ